MTTKLVRLKLNEEVKRVTGVMNYQILVNVGRNFCDAELTRRGLPRLSQETQISFAYFDSLNEEWTLNNQQSFE